MKLCNFFSLHSIGINMVCLVGIYTGRNLCGCTRKELRFSILTSGKSLLSPSPKWREETCLVLTTGGKATLVLYSRKIWRGIKFGGLAVYMTTAKLKSAKISYLHIYIHMAIPYRTAKFKSANTLAIAILDSTAKFNSRQYFQLYGT